MQTCWRITPFLKEPANRHIERSERISTPIERCCWGLGDRVVVPCVQPGRLTEVRFVHINTKNCYNEKSMHLKLSTGQVEFKKECITISHSIPADIHCSKSKVKRPVDKFTAKAFPASVIQIRPGFIQNLNDKLSVIRTAKSLSLNKVRSEICCLFVKKLTLITRYHYQQWSCDGNDTKSNGNRNGNHNHNRSRSRSRSP